MSASIPVNSTPANVFQTHFGALPGGQDPKSECEKWELLCGELLAERERLCAELEKTRLEKVLAGWDQEPIGSMEEVYATVVRDQTIEELIAELQQEEDAA